MGFRNTNKLASLLLAALLSTAATSQTLAHKGWIGSGITVAPWWQGAVLYQIDPLSFQDSKDDGFGDLRGIIQRLDYLQALDVDAVVLSPFQLQPEFRKSGTGTPFDPKYGSEEDLGQLVQEASRRRIRIFVDLPMDSSLGMQELEGEARFWLSRGIAGLRLTGNVTALNTTDRVRQLQRLCATYAGQRVLFWDLPQPIAASTPSRTTTRRHPTVPAPVDTPELQIDSRLASMAHLNVAELRTALTPVTATSSTIAPASVPRSDGTGLARSLDRLGDGAHDIEIAKIVATAVLTSQGAPLLYFGQEIGMATAPDAAAKTPDPAPMQWGGEPGFTSGVPWMAMGRNAPSANVALEDADSDSLLNWYRRLSALHHENAALHSGSMTLIADGNPDIVAWIRQAPGTVNAPVVVVCNLTPRSLLVSVAADVRRLGIVTGTGMMRTLASTKLSASTTSLGTASKQPESGPVSMNSIALPPFGIYIGELPRQPGLESVPSPTKRSRGSRASP